MKPKTRLFLSIGDVVLLGAFVCFAALKLPSLATFLLLFGSFLYLLVTFAVFFKCETALSGVRALCWVVAILWFEHETVTFLHQGALAKLSFLAAGGMFILLGLVLMKEIQKAATEEPKLSAKKAVTKLVASLVFFAVMTGFFANGIMTAASLTFAHRCLSEGTTEIVECAQSIPDRLGYTEYSVTFDVENGEQQQETVVVPVKKAFFETCAVGDVLRYALYDGCFGEEYVELIGMM